ncbi:DUF5658 family protein [Caldicellulosiruptoraceae bacterium PP1]
MSIQKIKYFLLILSLYLLNFIDAIFTYIGIKYSFIYEANPIMRFLIVKNPLYFLIFKVFFVMMCLSLIFIYISKYKYLIIAVNIILLQYSLVVIKHILIFQNL